MKPRTILLKFHSRNGEPGEGTILIAEAIDVATEAPVMSLSLEMMRAFLERHGYRYVSGSNGVWRQEGRAA